MLHDVRLSALAGLAAAVRRNDADAVRVALSVLSRLGVVLSLGAELPAPSRKGGAA